MRAKRRALTPCEVDKSSGLIQNNLFSLECIKNAKTVCVFLSTFKEPDTIRIVKQMWADNFKVVVPITNVKTGELLLSYIESMSDLKNGAYGILEPSVALDAHICDVDVILVPGLAFDREGGRMGFGKGYYDRLLENSQSVKIGICYDFQLCEHIPTEKHDVPMDFVVTEKEILKIG